MKPQQLIFKKPIKIFQVFRNVNVYGKSKKSFDDRKDDIAWKDIHSKAGHISGNELYLSEQILKNPDLENCDLIIIEDDNQIETFSSSDLSYTKIIGSTNELEYNYCFRTSKPNKFRIFEIRNNENIELHLKYGYFEVGIPERENFKLCEIKMNLPVEIKINGKTDFSMSSRRARVFKEQSYIFEYKGDFDKCKILKEPYEPLLKQVPIDRKLVDLNKPLW